MTIYKYTAKVTDIHGNLHEFQCDELNQGNSPLTPIIQTGWDEKGKHFDQGCIKDGKQTCCYFFAVSTLEMIENESYVVRFPEPEVETKESTDD